MAERLLQQGLDKRFPGQFIIESAGTGALVGNPIDPQVAGFIRVLGGTVDNFSARQLTPEMLDGKDLVLALSREHRSRIVEMSPSMLSRTFTFLEFSRLMSGLHLNVQGADGWRAALPKLLRARSAPTGPPDSDDVVDPFRKGNDVYQQMSNQLQQGIRNLLVN